MIWKSLGARTASTVILVPMVVGLFWYGGIPLLFFLLTVTLIMAFEWDRLNAVSVTKLAFFGLAGFSIAALVSMKIFGYPSVLAILGLAIIGQIVVTWRENRSVLIGAIGPIYIILPVCTLLWLADLPKVGSGIVFWLMVSVWTTDVFAYFVGGLLGGPKLAPRISPGKTWSGLMGGVLAATVIGGLLYGMFIPFDVLEISLQNFLLAALMAISAQIGDLGESWLKRKQMVKDSGKLIPGHGGLLDRVDGLILSTPLLAFLVFLANDNWFG